MAKVKTIMADKHSSLLQLNPEADEFKTSVAKVKTIMADKNSSLLQLNPEADEFKKSVAKVKTIMADNHSNPLQLNPDAHEFSPQNCRNSTQDPKRAAGPRGEPGFPRSRRSVSLDSKAPQENSDLPVKSFKNEVRRMGIWC